MTIFFLIIGLAAVIFCIAVLLLVLQVRSGQLDDLDTPAMRMLGDDGSLQDGRSDTSTQGNEDHP